MFTAADDLDPSWPPVLVAFVLGVAAVAVIAAWIMFRQARAASREHRKGARRGTE